MTPDRWQLIKHVLNDALELSPDQRPDFLKHACGDDATLRAEVDRLLAQAGADSSFLKPVTAQAMAHAVGRSDDSGGLIGRRVGQYTITGKIASGGMGTVYQAQQDHPRRCIALKIIQFAAMGESSLRRFEYEAHILGHLRHRGIVQIYEAGTFDAGDGARPFFAMELIDGVSILDFAERHALTVNQRLELMIRVCDAVQYAHQKGVIHRDLKPANILVIDEAKAHGVDAAGISAQPKILDFGVARALDADSQFTTMHTQAGELVGTIRYMSPEQIAQAPDDIDTRSDIYALGVICYELLTGRLPYDLRSGTVAEVSRTIADDEPIALGAVNRAFRGDLDTIIRKALEKDRARRYATAADFAGDLRRYLSNEPILARPPTTMYQLRKFAQRNRTLVGGVAATIMALAIGMGLYAREADRARDEADRANDAALAAKKNAELAAHESQRARDEAGKAAAVSQFLTRMLAKIDPNSQGQNVNIAELVDQAAAEIETAFADHPLNRAAVHDEVGTIYYNLGLYDRARDQYTKAREARVGPLGEDDAQTIAGFNNVGLALMREGKLDEAEPMFVRALDGRRRTLGDDHPQTLVTMNNLAMAYQIRNREGDLDRAHDLLRETLAAQQRTLGEHHTDTLATLTNLAGMQRARGDLTGAEALHRQAVAGFIESRGESHASTLVAMSNLAGTLRRTNKLEEAERYFRRAVEGLTQALGPEHNDTLVATHNLAQLLLQKQSYGEAEKYFRLAVNGFRKASGPQRDAALIALKNLGRSLQAQNKLAEAEAAYRESFDGYRGAYGDNDRRTRELATLLESLHASGSATNAGSSSPK